MIAPRFHPSIGGVEKHVFKVAEGLLEKGFSVTVLTTSHDKNLKSREIFNGIRIVRFPHKLENNSISVVLWMFRHRSAFSAYDVIHVHDPTPLVFWCSILKIIQPSKPLHVTFHGFERDPLPFRFVILRQLAKMISSTSICIGGFMEKLYGPHCDKKIIGAVRIEQSSYDESEGAVFVGRLEKDTGILEFIDALVILKREYNQDISLAVCGNGSLREVISNRSRKENLRIDLHGFVPNVLEMLQSSSICLAAGYLSILESLAVGVPVVTVANSALKMSYLKSMIAEGAPISVQTNPRGIALEVLKLMTVPELYSKISHSGIDFSKRMTWDNMINLYIESWES